MGLFKTKVADKLPKQFSIFQLMAVLQMEQEDHREARNILNQWVKRGYIKRISQNIYEQL